MSAKHIASHQHPLRPGKGKSVDMTEGSILNHIVTFAVPLLVGNLFQQLYNMVDTWVVGNYVSNEAFSAVGSVGPVINILIGIFTGFSSGAGVVISQNYGARRYDEVQKAVHTAAAMTVIIGIVFTFLGIFLAPYMLRLMKTPDEVFPQSSAYLTIYFGGIIGLMVYNIGAGILRAVGDSKRPFYFLMVCAVMNTLLDLLFVLLFKMGVEGVALATVISQATSALLITVTLFRTDTCVRVYLHKLRIHLHSLKRIVSVGIPASIQMAVTAFSNVFVQSYINQFGADSMSAWTAFSKVDNLFFLPVQSIALASTTFMGQNLGANQIARAKKGVTTAVILSICTTLTLLIPVMLFSRQIVGFFNSKEEVIHYGSMLMLWLTPFHIFGCFNQVYTGAMRGAGNTKAPMIIMLTSFVLFRQLYLFIMSQCWNELLPIAMSYPAGWILCSILTTLYYKKTRLDKTRVVDDSKN